MNNLQVFGVAEYPQGNQSGNPLLIAVSTCETNFFGSIPNVREVK